MQTIVKSLEDLSNFSGVEGCALVEANTGMVWHHAGKLADMERVGEAAVEFWRTQHRVARHLESLGELKFVTFKYELRTVALIPCDEDRGLVLVCLAGSQGVDWRNWILKLPVLRKAIRDYVMKDKIEIDLV